jgi:hypothetical protein
MRKVMCLFEETTPARGEKMMTPWKAHAHHRPAMATSWLAVFGF